MAIDNPKKRKDITREIQDRGKDMKKRLADAQRVVKDKKIESKTAADLSLQGTSEGAGDVKKALKHAGEATDKEHQKQERDLQGKVLEKAKKTEQELAQRGDAVKQDMKRLQQAVAKIDTRGARQGVKEGERGAQQDARFLSDAKRNQASDRGKGEKERDRQKREIQNLKISFRK